MKKHNQDSIKPYIDAYNIDASGLSAIVSSKFFFDKALPAFNNYEMFLHDRKKNVNSKKLIKKFSSSINTIKFNHSPEFGEILCMAQIAVCCELFDGCEIPIQNIQQSDFNAYIDQILDNAVTSNEKHKILTTKLHNSDAARTMHILRLLGLITSPSESFRQISFGAEVGNREIDGLHMMPIIKQKFDNATGSQKLCFKKQMHRPEYVVLVDNNPLLAEEYENYTNNNEFIIALNKDAEEAMSELAVMLDNREWLPLNFVNGTRIDHEMIYDVKRFFHYLTPLLGETADFIFTIGAGYTVEELRGRKKVMKEIVAFLRLCGMKPVRIVMHGGNTLEEARNSPAFGHIAFTTYEIVYCKLIRKKLMKHRIR